MKIAIYLLISFSVVLSEESDEEFNYRARCIITTRSITFPDAKDESAN